jgi:hypothetical protein
VGESHRYIKAIFFKPILHTSWIENHELTLKNNAGNIILVGNPVFAYLGESGPGSMKFWATNPHCLWQRRSTKT